MSEESKGRNVPKDQKVQFHVSRFRHFSYSSQNKGAVITKEYIDGITEHKFILSSGIIAPNQTPRRAYPSGKVPIKLAKINDLKKIANSLPHDENIQEFWKEVYEWPTTNQEEEMEEDN